MQKGEANVTSGVASPMRLSMLQKNIDFSVRIFLLSSIIRTPPTFAQSLVRFASSLYEPQKTSGDEVSCHLRAVCANREVPLWLPSGL